MLLKSIRTASIICFIFLCALQPVSARQADTSFQDIEFTEIKPDEDTVTSQTAGAVTKERPIIDKIEKQKVKVQTEDVDKSLSEIFLAGLIGGFLAFLMPCIFPMLPLTVSYFTKSIGSRRQGIYKALLYGFFIIVIYVFFGLAITVLFGADALNSLSTNGIFNFLFFLLLVAFGASFLGAFEITLPSKFVNNVDHKSGKGGVLGIFFMAATLGLVSFSCTGPIVGTLLVQAATKGSLLAPAIGMFGFSLALAFPFALFAMFPSLMTSLPKSGGWLNSIKVVLGFLELAFSLKFLSNVDLVYHWEWFDREVFLVLWITIFFMIGFYLLGKLRFSHDSELPYISVPRLLMSIVAISFSIYMIPGLWGAPLKSISAFLPPMNTQDFDLYTSSFGNGDEKSVNANKKHKYSELFGAPLGLDVYFDYEEGLAFAKSVNKPVMLDFTGHACVNCRKMEANVWSNTEVFKKLNNDYVIIQLYVDDITSLATEEQFTSKASKKLITNIGDKWKDFQITEFNSNSQPFYVLIDHNGDLLHKPIGANFNAKEYLSFLNDGLQNFQSQ